MSPMTAAALDAFQRGIVALELGQRAGKDAHIRTAIAHLNYCLEWTTLAQVRAEAHLALGDAWLACADPDPVMAARHYRLAAEVLLCHLGC